MNSGFYYPATSPLHGCPPGVKILLLVLACCAVFMLSHPAVLPVFAGLLAVLYIIAKIPWQIAFGQLRPAVLLLVLIFIAQAVFLGWVDAFRIVTRFALLILAASLVTCTTRAADMLDALQRALEPLAWLGLDAGRISLALSLAIRFIPIIAAVTREVREAQRVRGMECSVFAVAVPSIVRTLRMADEIADAIDARGYGGPARQ